MVHGVHLGDGRADLVPGPLRPLHRGERGPGRGTRSRASASAGMETANTNVVGIGGAHLRHRRGRRPPRRADPTSSTPIEHADLGGTPPQRLHRPPQGRPGHRRHPRHRLPLGPAPAQYVVIGPDARVKQVEPIEVADGPMVHDCSITERWRRRLRPPGHLRPRRRHGRRAATATTGTRRTRPGSGWCRSAAARSRRAAGSTCPVLRVPPRCSAYDDGTTVVLDVIRYDRHVRRSSGSAPTTPRPSCGGGRSTRPPGRSPRPSGPTSAMEFPRIDERLVGRPASSSATPPRCLGRATATPSAGAWCASTPPPATPPSSTSAPAASAASGSRPRRDERRRGRRLAAELRLRHRRRSQRARRLPRRRPHRRPGGPGAPAHPRPDGLPRQLGAGRRRAPGPSSSSSPERPGTALVDQAGAPGPDHARRRRAVRRCPRWCRRPAARRGAAPGRCA